MFWGIFDTQQEKNEKIAKAAYLEGRNADGYTRFIQHVVHESKTDPSIYDKNFNQWEADRDKFGPLSKDNPPVTRSAPEVEETPSDDDSSDTCDEISEETLERMSEILSEALENAREERERERAREERGREYAETRERIAREKAKKDAENEAKEAIKKNIYRLLDKIKSNRYTAEALKENLDRRMACFSHDEIIAWKYQESDEWKVLNLTGILRVLEKNEQAPYFWIKYPDPEWSCSAQWVIDNAKKEEEKAFQMKKHELKHKTDEELYDFIQSNPHDKAAIAALENIRDKKHIRNIYHYCVGYGDLRNRAKERFYEIVEREKVERAKRWIILNVIDLLFSGPTWIDDRL